jgi:hypothetical protein
MAVTDKLPKAETPEKGEESLLSVLKGALIKAVFVIGGLALVFESARNSLTWHLGRFWGSAGDNWQQLWEKALDLVS